MQRGQDGALRLLRPLPLLVPAKPRLCRAERGRKLAGPRQSTVLSTRFICHFWNFLWEN